MKGVAGRILIVDLTEGSWQSQTLPEEIYRKYLGGYGLGAWYIYNHIKPGCDPIGPDNILGFTPGLLTGSGYGLTGRYMTCGKSPLTGKGIRSNGEYCTGGWGNANSGGLFGPAIKRAGFDAIFFHGASEKPVYLLIEGDKISLENASFLWGKDIVETEEELKKLHGEQVHIAGIGEAGEKLSFISGIVNDKGRIAARSGLGAVMGSKKLKALCLGGNFKIEYADLPEMRRMRREYFAKMRRTSRNPIIKRILPLMPFIAHLVSLTHINLAIPKPILAPMLATMMAHDGTISSNTPTADIGDTPIKNYKGNAPDDFPFRSSLKIRASKVNKFKVQSYGCFACPVQCGAMVRYDKLPYEEKVVHRPEYETFASFCTMLCIDDLDIGMQASTYLNRAGMDTISAGATIAYILEAIEEGYFKKEDFACKEYPQGFLPQWGDPTYIMPLLRLMVTREGIGDKLADGTYMAALRFPETKGFDMSANGSEMGMHDSRYFKANAQNYIADPTPGRHTAGNYDRGESYGIYSFYPAVKPYINKAQTPFQMGLYSAPVIKMWQVMESLGMCSLVFSFGKYHLEEKIHAATGWDMKVEEFLEIGGRIQTLRQLFNAREGAIRHEMPQRVMGSPPLKRGGNKGTSVDPETIVQGYYRGMGFRQDGVPTEDTLHSYGLEYLVPDLEACTGVPEPLVNEYLADKEGSNGF
jgi:aldehyde:ferredoxin oxidoreductase